LILGLDSTDQSEWTKSGSGWIELGVVAGSEIDETDGCGGRESASAE
jgi:hypothetical protein